MPTDGANSSSASKPQAIVYRVLYTADKQRKLKRWQDGTLHIPSTSACASSKIVGNLLGTKPCDIDDDPWDYEAGREKKGYRRTPFVGSVKLQTNALQPGEVIETGRHIIEVQELSLGGELLSSGKVQSAPRSPARICSRRAREASGLDRSSKRIATGEPVCDADYAVLYTEDTGSATKNWHNGLLKYSSATSTACVYDPDNQLLFQRRMQPDEVQEGAVLESAKCALQICHRISPASTATPGALSKPAEVAGSTKKWYRLLYTEDKTKRIKRWVDGIVELESNLAKFWTEDQDRMLHKRQMPSFGEDITTGRYIFQVGDEIVGYKKGMHKEGLENDLPKRAEAVTRRLKDATRSPAEGNGTADPHPAKGEILPARPASEVMKILRTKELPADPQEHCPHPRDAADGRV